MDFYCISKMTVWAHLSETTNKENERKKQAGACEGSNVLSRFEIDPKCGEPAIG